MPAEINISAATDKAVMETPVYEGGELYAGLAYKVDDKTTAGVFVRRAMPSEQGKSWEEFLIAVKESVRDGKLDLSDLARLGMSTDLGNLF